jgi:hypothetical protein
MDDGMNDYFGDFREFLLSRLGQPVLCALCRRPTEPTSCRELLVPGTVVPADRFLGYDLVVHRTVWVCGACPG